MQGHFGGSGNLLDMASVGYIIQKEAREREKYSVSFQDSTSSEAMNGVGTAPGHNMEKELKASLAKLYQNYDFVTDEYDRLFEIVDNLREEYNNTKGLLIHHRYHEYKRMIKNGIRKWRSVEKRNSLAMSRKQSNASFALAISGSLTPGMQATSLAGIQEDLRNTGSFGNNINARLRANRDETTRELYSECTRLEREVFQYKARNQTIKHILCKLASDYDGSKQHVLHIWGRYKELKNMLKEVIISDI